MDEPLSLWYAYIVDRTWIEIHEFVDRENMEPVSLPSEYYCFSNMYCELGSSHCSSGMLLRETRKMRII